MRAPPDRTAEPKAKRQQELAQDAAGRGERQPDAQLNRANPGPARRRGRGLPGLAYVGQKPRAWRTVFREGFVAAVAVLV